MQSRYIDNTCHLSLITPICVDVAWHNYIVLTLSWFQGWTSRMHPAVNVIRFDSLFFVLRFFLFRCIFIASRLNYGAEWIFAWRGVPDLHCPFVWSLCSAKEERGDHQRMAKAPWWLMIASLRYLFMNFLHQNAHCMIYTHLSMNLSIDWSIDRSIHPSIHLSIYLPIYLPTYLPACLPACLPTYLIYLSILFYSIRFCSILFYSVLFYCTLLYSILLYSILF